MKSSQKEAGFQYIHLTSAINNPPSKINKSRSPSFSLSPDRKSIVTSKRHSLLIQREKPDIFSPTISQSRKGHRMSVCTQEEEIELITRKIGEKLLKQKKLDNLSLLSNNYTSLPTEERTLNSFRKSNLKSNNIINEQSNRSNKPKKKLNYSLNNNSLSKKKDKKIFLMKKIPVANNITKTKIPETVKENENTLVFKSTTKLNNYLIRDYHITKFDTNNEASKKKIKITEKTLAKINKIKMIQAYNKSINYLDNNENYYYQMYIRNKSINNSINKSYTEKEMKQIKKDYYHFRQKEKLKQSDLVFEKIKRLLKKEEYTNHSEGDTINYRNLQRVVKIKKILKKSLDSSITNKKKKLSKNEQDILLQMRKLGPPNFTKRAFKPKTIGKFNSANNTFFGVPV